MNTSDGKQAYVLIKGSGELPFSSRLAWGDHRRGDTVRLSEAEASPLREAGALADPESEEAAQARLGA